MQLKIDQRVFITPTKRKLDVNIVQSNFHIEITPRCASWFSFPPRPDVDDPPAAARSGTTTELLSRRS